MAGLYYLIALSNSWANGIVLKGDRVIIATMLRRKILDDIHIDHLGMEKCKRRSRQSVFWPGLSKEIDNLVERCDTFIRLLPSKSKEEMQPHALPTSPWQKISADLCTYGSSKYMIVTDYLSFWPEVYLLKDETAKSVIDGLKGVPREFVSDSGPQFAAREFKQFAK